MAEKKLLEVKIKAGTFYISSKEDGGEGWTRNEFTNPQNKEETLVRYHKELSVKGKVMYVAMKDDKFRGKVLAMIVSNEEESYSLQIPIMNEKGRVQTTNEYFNSIVGSLQNVSKGDEVTMFVNNDRKDKNDRLYRNIIILDAEGSLIKAPYNFTDVPKWESTEKKDAFGEVTKVWDATPTNTFYIEQMNKAIANFESSKESYAAANPKKEESNAPAPVKEQKPAMKPSNTFDVDEDDPLPF